MITTNLKTVLIPWRTTEFQVRVIIISMRKYIISISYRKSCFAIPNINWQTHARRIGGGDIWKHFHCSWFIVLRKVLWTSSLYFSTVICLHLGVIFWKKVGCWNNLNCPHNPGSWEISISISKSVSIDTTVKDNIPNYRNIIES